MDTEEFKKYCKNITKEEFISRIKSEEYWGNGLNETFNFWYDEYTNIGCPQDIGLSILKDKNQGKNCYDCWINSIKNIKFKNEI